MAVATVDNKKRITLKDAAPGEVYDVTYIGGGHFKLVRMKREPEPQGEAERENRCIGCSAPINEGEYCPECCAEN